MEEFKNTAQVNWKFKFFKTVPMVGDDGKPLQQNPPLNRDGFWEKSTSVASEINERKNKYRR